MRGHIRAWIGDRRGVVGFVAGALVAGSLAGGGVAIAAIPSSTTSSFTGCAARDNGALRVIDSQAGKRCRKSERRISWSKGWTYKGLWRATTSYRPGDVVLDNGSSYVARATSLAKPPVTDASRWGLLAAAGATGATGTAAVNDITYVQATQRVAPNSFIDRVITCPEGRHVVGGGVQTTYHRIVRSGPVDGDDADSIPDDAWQVVAENTDPLSLTVDMNAWAMCATATSIGSAAIAP